MSKPDWKVGHLDRVRATMRLLERGVARCQLALDECRDAPVTDAGVQSWFDDMLIVARKIHVESQRPPGIGDGP